MQDQGGGQLLARDQVEEAGKRREGKYQVADQRPGPLEQGPADGIEKPELDGLQQRVDQRQEARQLALLGKTLAVDGEDQVLRQAVERGHHEGVQGDQETEREAPHQPEEARRIVDPARRIASDRVVGHFGQVPADQLELHQQDGHQHRQQP
jgi:hypothetical protein